MKTNLSAPMFTDVDAARAHLESLRWPDGAYCPHCGEAERVTKLQGKSTRPGVYKCKSCRKPFSVTVGTLFERSHIPLNKWLLGFHLMAASKKGMSAHQLHRMLGVTYKTAWFMAHRIREAMTETKKPMMGGPGSIVEVDETYQGKVKDRDPTKVAGPAGKRPVVALVERGGEVRAFHVPHATKENVQKVVFKNTKKETVLHTDESRLYGGIRKHFADHQTVRHTAGEYARGDVHTNTIEGFFSIFKRGMHGVYQHCGEQHLQRYLNEFSFRYTERKISDVERSEKALKGITGKRLTYRRTDNWTHGEA